MSSASPASAFAKSGTRMRPPSGRPNWSRCALRDVPSTNATGSLSGSLQGSARPTGARPHGRGRRSQPSATGPSCLVSRRRQATGTRRFADGNRGVSSATGQRAARGRRSPRRSGSSARGALPSPPAGLQRPRRPPSARLRWKIEAERADHSPVGGLRCRGMLTIRRRLPGPMQSSLPAVVQARRCARRCPGRSAARLKRRGHRSHPRLDRAVGQPPSVLDWSATRRRRFPWRQERYDATGRDWPTRGQVLRIYGRWESALRAAGVRRTRMTFGARGRG